MKKLIVILIVFALLAGAMTAEIVFVDKYYSSLQAELEVISDEIELNEEHIATPELIDLCEKATAKWEKRKKLLLMLQNHNTVRGMDDKLISLTAVVKSDNYNDAVIFVNSAINYVDDILLDSIPYLSNLL